VARRELDEQQILAVVRAQLQERAEAAALYGRSKAIVAPSGSCSSSGESAVESTRAVKSRVSAAMSSKRDGAYAVATISGIDKAYGVGGGNTTDTRCASTHQAIYAVMYEDNADARRRCLGPARADARRQRSPLQAARERRAAGLANLDREEPKAHGPYTRAVSLGKPRLPEVDDVSDALAIAEGDDYR
jgi:hypothetical protein